MQKKMVLRNKWKIVFFTLFLVSVLFNLFQAIVNTQYKRVIEQQCYDNIEEIRYRNENILTSMDSYIKAGSITNDELLSLYKNYAAIVDCEVNLWEYYFNYKNNPYINTKNKKVNLQYENKYEMFWKVEELVYSYIQKELTTYDEHIIFTKEQLSDFQMLKEWSQKISNYYSEFYEEHCEGLDSEARGKVIIDNSYWIEILKELEIISEEYVDYEFSYIY